MQFLKDLNPVQQEAVKAVNGPVMIIAGAGSGKTRVLTYRIAYLLASGVRPSEIIALTFTNKAANEMKGRILKLVGEEAASMWMGTFHSMFARILRRECESLGYTKSFTIYDADDSLNVIKACMGQVGVSPQQVSPQLLRALVSRAKNQLLTPKGYEERARDFTEEKAAAVYKHYERMLERNNAMDFDDLLTKPIQLFTRYAPILQRYQHRFKFVLVDEFQDTNRAQYEVTRLVGGKYRNVCVVGDDAQSIYSFRGADIRNILDFAKDYADCTTFRLEQNYRSTKTILGAADQVIRNNIDQFEKKLWTDNPEGDPIVQMECIDDRDEAHSVVQVIQQESVQNKYDLKDFAVLYRTNAQSRSLEDELRRRGIPYVIVGGIKFYERKEIKDILAYLRLLVNPMDNESFMRIVNYPARGIGDTTLKGLRTYAEERDLPFLKALGFVREMEGINDRGKNALELFSTFVKKYSKLRSEMSFSELSRSIVDELGILKSFKEEGTAESMNRWENVQELLSAISEFQDTREEGTLEQFLEEVSLVSDIDTWEGTKNAVTLMTLHSSKGLEFPVVIISGMEEGLLPFYSNTLDRPELEEERRLFYVGMTRAQKKLYLTRTKMRYRFGEPSYLSPSRFLAEISGTLLHTVASRSSGRMSESLHGNGLDRRGNGRKVVRKPRERDEAFVGDTFPDYESESQEYLEVRRGALVIHETFGKGKVIEVKGKGEAMKAVVQFEQFGIKNLIIKFAKLRPA